MGPFAFFLPPSFDRLPVELGQRLLAGVMGRNQAAQAGLGALRGWRRDDPATASLAGLGLALTRLACDLDPLNADMARACLAMAGPGGQGEDAAALHLAAAAPWTATWRQALAAAEQSGDWEAFLDRFDASWPADGAHLAARVEGLAALTAAGVAGSERLERWRARLPGPPASPGLAWLAAEATLRLGGRLAGITAFYDFLCRWPWCVNALLRLYDLQTGVEAQLTELPGELVIFLYTFNKADDLAVTLDDVHRSRLGRFRIFALDNGSTDATPQVLSVWQERFGAERFSILRAPVNVGAPAGRNWLKALPEAATADFVAYLDDDIRLEPDWALRLGAAVAAYPGQSAYGCRVTDAGRPSVLQAAEFHLAPGGPGEPATVTDLQLQAPDLGQWAYCRPCLSVTGCCHLFSAAALASGGDFDIRFSPSQFDDLERDMRVFLAGQSAVYQGHLVVGHKRRSGGDARRDRLAGGNAHGNLTKLQAKFDAGDLRRLRRFQDQLLLTDVRKKALWLTRQ
ncbi:glycosyltransferase [Desulfovibrio aerotolerans]|uniref:Glycosyltransferase n=1 Tax=Solidesulfovibrio aerotolerans TaxID=295255 RepID=A0A7C9IXG9_9BACT|nr:glycosyltransferase [Solidesulfovibrio aerotolerans]